MSRATIEFKEVARKYALGCIQKDVKIDVDSAKREILVVWGLIFDWEIKYKFYLPIYLANISAMIRLSVYL